MLGAVIGDLAGSRFEKENHKSKDFELLSLGEGCRLTDDSIMSLAVAKAILACDGDYTRLPETASASMREYGRAYPLAGYGARFREWIQSGNPQPYCSYGNGAAMRVSACGFAAETLEEAAELSKMVTGVTHNHPEAMKAAEAVAAAVFLARKGRTMQEIRSFITGSYYTIDFSLDSIRPDYSFDVSCQGSVPQAFEAFFESTGFEDAVRNAVSIGGDSDTIAAITGSMAEAYYGIPEELRRHAAVFLDEDLLEIVNQFETRFHYYRESTERIQTIRRAKKAEQVKPGRHLAGRVDFDLKEYLREYFGDSITMSLAERRDMGQLYFPVPPLDPEIIRRDGAVREADKRKTVCLLDYVRTELKLAAGIAEPVNALFASFQALDTVIMEECKAGFFRRNRSCLEDCAGFSRYLYRCFFASGLAAAPDIPSQNSFGWGREQEICRILFHSKDGLLRDFQNGDYREFEYREVFLRLSGYLAGVYRNLSGGLVEPSEIGTALRILRVFHETLTSERTLRSRASVRNRICQYIELLYAALMKGNEIIVDTFDFGE